MEGLMGIDRCKAKPSGAITLPIQIQIVITKEDAEPPWLRGHMSFFQSSRPSFWGADIESVTPMECSGDMVARPMVAAIKAASASL